MSYGVAVIIVGVYCCALSSCVVVDHVVGSDATVVLAISMHLL